MNANEARKLAGQHWSRQLPDELKSRVLESIRLAATDGKGSCHVDVDDAHRESVGWWLLFLGDWRVFWDQANVYINWSI